MGFATNTSLMYLTGDFVTNEFGVESCCAAKQYPFYRCDVDGWLRYGVWQTLPWGIFKEHHHLDGGTEALNHV